MPSLPLHMHVWPTTRNMWAAHQRAHRRPSGQQTGSDCTDEIHAVVAAKVMTWARFSFETKGASVNDLYGSREMQLLCRCRAMRLPQQCSGVRAHHEPIRTRVFSTRQHCLATYRSVRAVSSWKTPAGRVVMALLFSNLRVCVEGT